MPHKRSHAAQSADRRPSRNTGTNPHDPAAQPAIFPVTSFPIPAGLSYPSPLPKQSPTRPALPYHVGTDPHGPAVQPAIYPVYQLPHSRTALLSKPCFPQSEARHTPRFPTTQAQTHTTQPPNLLSSSSPPISRCLFPHSPSDPYKNPGSRPPPGFFVISGSVRFPSQRRLR